MVLSALSLIALLQTPSEPSCTLEGTLRLEVGDPSEAVVYLKDVPVRTRPRPRTHIVKQKNLKFVPSSIVVQVNDTVDFTNDDGDKTLHSVFSTLGNDPFSGDTNKRSTTFSRTFTREGPVHVQCNLHKSMATDVLVLSGPVFTRPDPWGHWRLDGLERRAYTLVVWEPNGGELRREVACGAGEVALELTKKAPPAARRRDGTIYPPGVYADALF